MDYYFDQTGKPAPEDGSDHAPGGAVIAVAIRFLAGRYHATPWNRHVNEAAVEWPPSPWRFLRALVSTWKVCVPDAMDGELARQLFTKLAKPPKFMLPQATVGHTRHYMPWFKKGFDDKTMVFDAFVAVRPDDELIMVWDGSLDESERTALCRLLFALGYMGRAESWCEARLLSESECSRVRPNCLQLGELDNGAGEGMEAVPVLLPDPSTAFSDEHVPATKGTRKAPGIALCDPPWNLCLDTAQLGAAGWSDPPGSVWARYGRIPDAFTPPPAPRKAPVHQAPTWARFALDGPVLPKVTETLRVAEATRRVLMGCYRAASERLAGMDHGVSRPGQFKSATFSGKDQDGNPLKGHLHAFFLPLDEDGDGFIDHVEVMAGAGFDPLESRAISMARRIVPTEGLEIGLVLQGLSLKPPDKTARVLRSSTPFIATRHLKARGTKRDPAEWHTQQPRVSFLVACLREEISRRGLPDPVAIHPLIDEQGNFRSRPDSARQGLRAIQFARSRMGRRLDDGARRDSGFFELVFQEPVIAPFAVGHNCHFGLGLFIAQPG